MLTTLSFAGISSLMALFITEPRLGLVTEDMTSTKRTQLAGNMAGLFIMTLAMSQFLSLGFLFQRIKKCLGLLHTGSIGCIMLGTGVGLIAFANDYRVLFATQSLVGFGNGFQTQVSTIFLSGFARPEFAARTLAIGTLFDSVGNVLGPNISQVYRINPRYAFWICAGFGYLSAAICLVLQHCFAHSNDDKAKHDEQQKANHAATSSKDIEMVEDSEKRPLIQHMHPAFYRGENGKDTVPMYGVADHLYHTMHSKHHFNALSSSRPIVRKRALIAHNDYYANVTPTFSHPQNETEQYLKEVANFLAMAGHGDWGLNVPGVTADDIVATFRTPM